ncbi:MAG: RagB/SusD family nutrient uptake outer membrane protein [Candidatus Nephrothrix sp. EaCA]|nr:MAG: RagB/SusD family nutrient uptake outer membrane protein [Candidatus Nephrothrix sp. EaCA]
MLFHLKMNFMLRSKYCIGINLKAMFICVLCLWFSSCAKELDKHSSNPNQLTAANFYKTPSDANSAILGIYGYITTPFNLGIAGTEVRNQRSDEMSSVSDYSIYGQHLLGKGSSSYVSDNPYQLMYVALFAANDALEKIPSIPFSDGKQKDGYIGEAYFLRAYCHFCLLLNYRNIVLYDKTPNNARDFTQPQAKPDEAWNKIIADLQKAKKLLPKKGSAFRTGAGLGRATQGSAAGLLGKAYLYRAGIEKQSRFYASSAKTLDTLIRGDFGAYSLMPNYGDNFGAARENNDESVFELQFRADIVNISVVPGTANGGLWFEPRSLAPPGFPVQSSGEGVNNNWVLDAFKASADASGNLDSRAFGTLIFDDQNIQKKSSDQVTLFEGQNFRQAYPAGKFPGKGANFTSCNRKWLDFTLTAAQFKGSARNNGVNYRYLRYSDVLLMFAEALVMSGSAAGSYSGKTALQAVNDVRQRASVNLPALYAIDMEAIKKERILELTNEGHRFYDLLRWNELESRFQFLENADPFFKQFNSYNKYSSKDAYMPIPLVELTSNPTSKQNDGW